MSRLHDAARTDPRAIGVSVILSSALRRRLPGTGDGPQRHVLAPGATLADLLAALGLDPSTDLTAAIDGELADPQTPLHDGAEIMLLAPMEGGAVALGAAAEGEATIRNAVKGICSKPTRAESSKLSRPDSNRRSTALRSKP